MNKTVKEINKTTTGDQMKIEIPFLDNREPLTYEADSIAEAVARAVKEDADLTSADLSHADLSNADLSDANLAWANLAWANLSNTDLSHANLQRASLIGAKVQDKTLWGKRPFLSLGQCGFVNRTTLAFFFEDGSEPFIMCGCFKGGLKEFKARIKETHSGTFYEIEYNAMAKFIKTLHKEQQEK